MRQLVLITAKFTVSVTLLYFAASRINFDVIGNRLNRLDIGWILAAVSVALLQTGLVAIRWRRIALLCGAALPTQQAVRFTMIAAFFNQVLPSTVGGDAARILLLARSGAGVWKATYSVLLDRFIGVLALATLVAASLYWSFGLIENPIGRAALLIIGLGSIAAGAAFLLPGHWRSLERWRLTRRLVDMALLARQILFSRSSSPMIVLPSLLIHVMTTMIAWSVAQAVAARFGFIDAFLLVLPVMLIATIPISIAGWGVRESALVLAFSYAGLPESDGLIVSVLLGGVMFVVGIIGGITWLVGSDSLRISAAWQSQSLPPP
jgi:glycosyltransferase 2 family protein